MTNRELDAEIAEKIYDWRLIPVGKDAAGENACEILFPPGREATQDDYNMLPRVGKLHRGFLAPRFSSEISEAIELAVKVEMKMDVSEIDFLDWQFPEKLAKRCLEFWEKQSVTVRNGI
jgi:hypothetical protein